MYRRNRQTPTHQAENMNMKEIQQQQQAVFSITSPVYEKISNHNHMNEMYAQPNAVPGPHVPAYSPYQSLDRTTMNM